jgi:hypothetical protein
MIGVGESAPTDDVLGPTSRHAAIRAASDPAPHPQTAYLQ